MHPPAAKSGGGATETIYSNAAKHNLCASPQDYRYSSFGNYYLNDHSLIEVDID
jgi:hypothetical protein